MLEEMDHLIPRSCWVYWTYAHTHLYYQQSLTHTLSVPVRQDAESVPLRSAQTLISCEGDGWTARIQGVKRTARWGWRESPESLCLSTWRANYSTLIEQKKTPHLSLSLSPVSLFPLTFSLSFISVILFQTCWPMFFSQSLLKKSLENTTMMEIKIATAFAQS